MEDFAYGRNKTPLPPTIQAPFNWNSKMAELFPDEWLLQDEWASEKATVKDILAHLSGFPRYALFCTVFLTFILLTGDD